MLGLRVNVSDIQDSDLFSWSFTQDPAMSYWEDNSKDWQSPFDPTKQSNYRTGKYLNKAFVELKNLPQGKFVVPREPNEDERPEDLVVGIRTWLANQGIKVRIEFLKECDSLNRYTIKRVYIFKKKKDAVLFKLTWS